jgi:O-antigen ligase
MILAIDKSYFPIKKIGLIFITIISISLIIFANKTIFLKQTELFKRIMIVEDNLHFFEKFKNIKYIQHYKLAIDVFNDHKILGVGSKNFRFKCQDEKYYDKNVMKFNYNCSTHPHQLHFEILSEQGIIGYLLILYFFIIFFRNFIKNKSKDNILYNSINIYLIVFLIPLLPSGSIFSTFNGSLFWLIFSIAFLFNEKKLNF